MKVTLISDICYIFSTGKSLTFSIGIKSNNKDRTNSAKEMQRKPHICDEVRKLQILSLKMLSLSIDY